MSPEEIELYQDAIKIGVPALVGLLAGLIPYFVERKKVSIQRVIEQEKGRRELIISFSEALSKYIGSSSTYINYLLSSRLSSTPHHQEQYNKWTTEAGEQMQKNQEDRVKAKALIGIVGNVQVINSMLEYDKSVSEVIHVLNNSNNNHEEAMEKMKNSEKELLYALVNLI